MPSKQPVKNLDGFLGLNKSAEKLEDKPKESDFVQEELPKPVAAPIVEAVEEEEPILEAREEPEPVPVLQHLNKHSQDYVYQKL